MSTVPADTNTVVPVTCAHCGEDMSFTIEWSDINHRCWTLHCPNCFHTEEFQHQHRHQLWANQNTFYVGSYWGPDE